MVVAGPPGAGKTTLARALAPALSLPLLCSDDIKSGLAETRGVPADADAMRALGQERFRIFYDVVGRLLDAGVSVVAEAAYHRGLSEEGLRPLLGRSRATIVHCTADHALLEERFRARHERGERHPCHPDAAFLVDLETGARRWSLYDPLDLDAPTLEVDTTNGWSPALDDILTFIRTA